MPQPTQDQLTATYGNDTALGLPQGTTARQLGVESAFDPTAVSPKGARGYAQVMPKTLATLSERAGRKLDPTNFDDSLLIQREVMGENMKHFGNIPDALRAYNSGWDTSKWDNPETNAYVQKIAGADPITKKLMLSQNGANFRQKLLNQQAGDRTELDATQQFGNMSIVDAGVDESGAELADQTHYAGLGESIYQTFQWDTVTGRIADLFRQEQPETGFQASSGMAQSMAQNTPLVYRNDDLREYVQGADSTREWNRRLSWAQERADFQQRAAQTRGIQSWANGAATLVTGMADPVTLLATMGAGSVINAARGAYVTAEASSALRAYAGAATGGALGNMAVDATVRKLGNNQIHWPEMFQQGLVGAVLGGAGHWVGNRFGNRNRSMDSTVAGAEATDHATIQRNIDDAGAQPIGNRGTGTYASDILDTPSYGPDSPAAGEGARAPTPMDAPVDVAAQVVEEPRAPNRDQESANVGYDVAPTLENTRYSDLHNKGIITELRTAADLPKVSEFQAKYGQDIPANAKAFYSPQEDRAYIFADRLTAADRADPTGLLMHEIGVHYGLERTIGTERYTGLLDSLAKSADPRVKAAIARVPLDTPEHLRMEETLGYLAEHNPKLGVISGFVADIRNWLRETIPMFRRMALTTNDVLRYVRGSLENVRRNGRLSNDLTFPHVWHGSPTRGIDALDLSYAGSGEGNSAFGFGHYLTSEKGTALDYRNKESARRGIAPDEGGLYRVKLNASRDELLSWDKPISEQPAIMEALRGHVNFTGASTGRSVYNKLTEELGSQRAASEYLNEAGIKGVQYETGRTRGTENPSSNYVMFSNEHVDISDRYSTNPAPMPQPERDDIRLGPRADAFKQQIDNWQDVTPEETDKLRQRASAWYEFTKHLPVYKQFREMFDSVGLTLGQSKSKGVRMWASRLGEDATGANRQHATSAAIDKERLQAGWITPVREAWHRLLPAMVSDEEKAILSQGPLGGAIEKRVGKEIAIERLTHRKAVQAGQEYASKAPDPVRKMAGVMDSFFKDVGETGEAVGDTNATAIKKIGYVGYQPYKWDWAYIHQMYNTDPAKFNSFKSMLREQYMEKVMNPTMDKFLSAGPQIPDEVTALREATQAKVEHLVDNYINQVMRDPESRVSGKDDHFATIATDILRENWDGERISAGTAQAFKERLGEIIKDRSRTEFDLIRKDGDGNMLLDFMDTDVGRMLSGTSSQYAGTAALAKAGIRDTSDRIALKDALRQDGATPKEIDNIDFLIRSLADELGNKEMGAAKLLRQAAHFSMMGGLGFNALADAGSVAATVGIKGFMQTMAGMRLNPNSPIIQELAKVMPSVIGMDHRFHIYDTTASHVAPESILAQGSSFNRVMDAGGQMVNTLSGMKHVNQMVHNGYLPVMMEDMIKAIHGTDGGMTKARLADTGLFGETVGKIKAELDKHAPNYKRGDEINIDNWDDQSVADDFKNAVHRAAGQSLQRSFVGETPRWMSEGVVGSVMGQFKRFGITAAEKQAARNAFIGDANAATGFAFATAWGAALYYAKTLAKTTGMDESQRDKYMTDNMSGMKLATGVMVMINMAGLLPDAADLTQTLLGGGSHASGSPVAALGALQNIGKAAGGVSHAVGSAIGLVDHPDYVKDFKNAWRIVPGSNTIFGAALVNSLSAKQ